MLPIRETLIGLAACPSVDDLRFPALAAVQLRRVAVADLLDCSRVGRPHLAHWRTVAAEAAAGARSGPEAVYWRAIRAADLPQPHLNAPFEADGRRYVIDAYWPEYRLGVEIDGRRHHERRQQFEYDRVRQNDLLIAGVVLLRFPAAAILRDAADAAAVTARALASCRARDHGR